MTDPIAQRREELYALALKHFPYETPNPGQIESCVESVRLFETGIKHVIIQAPTGIGKSAITVVVHRMLRELEEGHRTSVITASKGLQDQIVGEFKEVFDLKGRTNYACPHDKGPYNSGTCRAHVKRGGCVPKEECPYVKRRMVWCNKADIRLTNNSFQIEAPPELCMKPENRVNLIVADECHELDDYIVEHTSIKMFAPEYIALANFGYGSFAADVEKTIEMFRNIPVGQPFKFTQAMNEGMKDLSDKVSAILDDFTEMMEDKTRRDHEAIGAAMESLQLIGDKTAMLESAADGEWIINEYEARRSILIKPIFAWQVADYALFRKADKFLHLSATICGFNEYAGTLGLKEGEFECLDIPNPIPVENRKVYVVANQKISGGFDVHKLSSDIDKLISMHGTDNGIIHTVSYALANQIYMSSAHRSKMLVSKERQEIISELKKVNTGRVVLSAAIEKGFDFKGDMSRFQIIAKVPYLYLGDPLVKLNAERRPGWYARKAVLRIVQACGRSIRGVNDHAKTYVMDLNFKRLFSQNRDLFPQWFVDSVVMRD